MLEEKGEKALGEEWLLEGQELGIETMVEQMTAAAGKSAASDADILIVVIVICMAS